jgi:hypothetical protein
MFAPGTANFRVGAIDKSIEARTDQEHGPGDFQTAVVMRFKCSRGPHRVGGYSKSDDEIGKNSAALEVGATVPQLSARVRLPGGFAEFR